MATRPLKDFKGLLNESLQLFSRHWLRLLGISLVSILPILFLFYLLFYAKVFVRSDDLYVTVLINQILYLSVSTVVSLYSLWGTGALFLFIDAAYQGRRSGILQSYKEAAKVYLKYLKINVRFVGKVLLWALALVFPGIYFGALYNYAPLIVLLGHRPEKEALVYSAQLVRPHIVKYLDYLLFALVCAGICCAPFVVIFDFVIEQLYAKDLFRLGQVFDFFQILVFVLAFQFVWVFYYVVFEALRKSEKG